MIEYSYWLKLSMIGTKKSTGIIACDFCGGGGVAGARDFSFCGRLQLIRLRFRRPSCSIIDRPDNMDARVVEWQTRQT